MPRTASISRPEERRSRRQTEHAAMPRTKRQSVRRAKRIPAAAAVNPPGAFSVAVQNLRDFDCCLLDSRSGSIPTPGNQESILFGNFRPWLVECN